MVLAGRPNAGKSSLLNALAGRDSAIVTPIAGTTRDVLREHIHLDGMPLHIIDTAGLRESPDEVEQEGIRRAWNEIQQADCVLLLVPADQTDSTDPERVWPEFVERLEDKEKLVVVRNKIDLVDEIPGISQSEYPVIRISATTKAGIEELCQYLKEKMGYQMAGESGFTARQRHIDALNAAKRYLDQGLYQLMESGAGELLAEDLRMAQQHLGEITGQFTSDDLLGKIFSSFCIGK